MSSEIEELLQELIELKSYHTESLNAAYEKYEQAVILKDQLETEVAADHKATNEILQRLEGEQKTIQQMREHLVQLEKAKQMMMPAKSGSSVDMAKTPTTTVTHKRTNSSSAPPPVKPHPEEAESSPTMTGMIMQQLVEFNETKSKKRI